MLQFLQRTTAAVQSAQLRSLPARLRPGGSTQATAEPSRALRLLTYLLPEGPAPPRQQVQKDLTSKRFAEAPASVRAPSPRPLRAPVRPPAGGAAAWGSSASPRPAAQHGLAPPGGEGTCRHLSSLRAACFTCKRRCFPSVTYYLCVWSKTILFIAQDKVHHYQATVKPFSIKVHLFIFL